MPLSRQNTLPRGRVETRGGFGWKHTVNERPNRASAKFYNTYSLAHIVGAVLVLASVDLVNLAVDVEVMNELLLPIVLGLLLALEARALPEQWRMRGLRTWFRRRAAGSERAAETQNQGPG